MTRRRPKNQPPLPGFVRIRATLYMHEDEKDALKTKARQYKMSMSNLATEAVVHGLGIRRKRP
jgi:hypothetical protein